MQYTEFVVFFEFLNDKLAILYLVRLIFVDNALNHFMLVKNIVFIS